MPRCSRLRVCRVTARWNLRETPRAKTCDPSPHHAVKDQCRPRFDPLHQRQAVRVIKDRHRPGPASLRALRLIRPTGPEALTRSTRSSGKLSPGPSPDPPNQTI